MAEDSIPVLLLSNFSFLPNLVNVHPFHKVVILCRIPFYFILIIFPNNIYHPTVKIEQLGDIIFKRVW